MAQPCRGSSSNIFNRRRSRVPWTRSFGLLISVSERKSTTTPLGKQGETSIRPQSLGWAAPDDDLLDQGPLVILFGQGVHGAQLGEQVVDELPEARSGRAVREGALVLDRPGDERHQERDLGRRQIPGLAIEIGAGRGPET